MSENNLILYRTENSVATITLNRPDKLNAVTDPMLAALRNALKNAARDNRVRSIILTGAGRGFCAGQDLSAFGGERSANSVYDHLMGHYRPIIKLMHTVEKPLIGAINGIAAGAGASLALACDLRIMSTDASLMQAFSNIGFIPDSGSTWFLVRLVGYSHAFEIAIEGERISAQRCLELGLANRLASPENLRTEATGWAEKLAQRATYAIGLTKRAMNRAANSSLLEAVEYEAHLQQLASESEDFAEGVKAFVEKRPPEFKGIP